MRTPSDTEAHAPLKQLDPTFCEMAVTMGECAWDIEALTQREKSLLSIVTDMCRRGATLADYGQKLPLGRVGQPDDIAKAIAFLIADSFVTEHVLVCDGGMSLA